MFKVSPDLPEPALKAFLDDVVIPILVERFLREHQEMGATSPTESGDATKGVASLAEGVSETLLLRDETHPSPFFGHC